MFREVGMAGKPISWTMTTLLFVTMMVAEFALNMIFSPGLRHQAISIHSAFWQVVVPADLLADAIFVIAMRAVFNWLNCGRNRAAFKAPRAS